MTEKPDIERRKLLRSAAVAGAVLGATSSAVASRIEATQQMR